MLYFQLIDFEHQAVRADHFDLNDECPIHVMRHIHPPRGEFWDMHFVLEIGIVLSGEMTRLWQGCRRALGVGDVWLNGIWEPHGGSVERGCEVGVVIMQPQWLSSMPLVGCRSGELLAPFFAPPSERPHGSGMRRRMLRIFQDILDNTHDQAMLQALLAQAMLTLREGWNHRALPAPHDQHGRIRPAVELALRARRFIGESEAASACGMSLATFKRTFGRTFGLSFARFALRQRLSGASRDLSGGTNSAKQVAYEWGFTDAAHFCRAFKKHYGLSPTRFRQANQNSRAAQE